MKRIIALYSEHEAKIRNAERCCGVCAFFDHLGYPEYGTDGICELRATREGDEHGIPVAAESDCDEFKRSPGHA